MNNRIIQQAENKLEEFKADLISQFKYQKEIWGREVKFSNTLMNELSNACELMIMNFVGSPDPSIGPGKTFW